MYITRLTATNIRRVRAVDITPLPGLNVVIGKNGSGKTSLLESIYLLGSGRSFRTRRVNEVITEGESGLTAYAEVGSVDGTKNHLGIEKSGSRTRLRIDNQDTRRMSDLARVLPAVFIGPDCLNLLTEGAELRRRLLDWVMFHVEPNYLGTYHRFNRVLKQRNALLKEGASNPSLEGWNRQFGEQGEALHAYRARHADRLCEFAGRFLGDLLPMAIELVYRPGWDTEKGLAGVVNASLEHDRRLGFTRYGPQRADLSITTRGRAARVVLSRGESRLLAMSLHLAQAAYFGELRSETPVVLVDDLGTELDQENCARFVSALDSLTAQTFITTVSQELPILDEGGGQALTRRMFHVERGSVSEML